MIKNLLRLFTLCAAALVGQTVAAQDVTALWDWQNGSPSGIKAATNFQKTSGTIASNVEGIVLTVDATSGKLQGRDSDAQFNSGTKIQVPVQSTNDVVTVTSYPGYHNYTVGGTAADADVVEHKALSTEVAQGYVEIVGTGSSYLYSIKVVQKSMIQEKTLYSTNFTTWSAYETAASESVSTATWKTKYSHEDLTFSVYNSQITSTNKNPQKFTKWEGGYIMAAKSADPYITTSALASITKVHFIHGATGSNRGWKLEAKGDGDTDWVTISDAVANPSSGAEVTATVNRTNCQLRFTNLNTSQNAYLFQLDIYGNVDMSLTPALGTFTYAGTTYQVADIFEEEDEGVQTATIELFNDTELPSTSNPLTEVTADNGTAATPTYTTTSDGVVASISVTANGETVVYNATFIHKPYYTLTYYNTDGSVLESTQQVEKDKTISTLRDDSDVTVADGKKFRGWFVSADGGRKYTTGDVVTSNLSLYAVATDIEKASTTATYRYVLTDQYFYAEDHEVFGFSGNGKWHDAQHGWAFSNGDVINIPVGGNAYIIFTSCRYAIGTNSTIDVTDANGNTVGSVSATVTTDGGTQAIQYTGAATTLTVTFNGGAYVHTLVVANTQDSPIEKNAAGYYIVQPGDANNFIATLLIANATASADARTYVFLPDGTYDLGETTLTAVSGDNMSIIGQSTEKTIIKNAPDVKNEGIDKTATLYVTGSNLYLQDLTLQNALDYYNSGSAGRAVCLWDKGNKTICKNVKMLSYQDTYYSNNNSGKFYWEDSEIHGTVDYLCGGGDVYYNRCKFVNEKRSADGSGACTIAAPYTDGTEWGYVMNSCTIQTLGASFNLGRAWGGTPRLAYINTTILEPSKIASNRFTTAGMNVAADKFVEYNSVDADGKVVSPPSNILTFTKGETKNTYETILTADEAAAYALSNVFLGWTPDQDAAQKTISTLSTENSVITWEAVSGAIAYAVFNGDTFVDITTETTYTVTEGDAKDYKVRAANAMGGFGVAAGGSASAIKDIENAINEDPNAPAFNLLGQRVGSNYRGIVIRNGKKFIVK